MPHPVRALRTPWVAAVGLALLSAAALWVAFLVLPLAPAVRWSLAVALVVSWWVLAWGRLRLPEFLITTSVAALVAAYALAFIPHLRPLVAGAALLGPPVAALARHGLPDRPEAVRRLRISGAAVAAIVGAAAVVALIPTQTVVHVLTWGYDNSAHTANAAAFLRQGTFFFLDDRYTQITLTGPEYPAGVYAVWSVFAVLARLGQAVLPPDELASLYAVCLLMTAVCVVAAAGVLTRRVASMIEGGSDRLARLLGWGAAIVVAAGSLSHLLWSGWPSLLMSIIILLALLTLAVADAPGSRGPWFWSPLAVLVIAYSYPLLLLLAGVITLGFLVKVAARDGWRSLLRRLAQPLTLVVVVVSGALCLYPLTLTLGLGGDTLLIRGGIEPMGTWMAAALGLLALAVVAVSVMRRDWLLVTVTTGMSAVAAGVCVYSIAATGSVQYYPMRLVYAAAVAVLCLGVGSLSGWPDPRRALAPLAVCVAAVVVVSGYKSVYPQVFREPFMGSTVEVARAVAAGIDTDDSANVCVNAIVGGAEALAVDPSATAFVLAGPHEVLNLGIRWANALGSRWTETVWNLEVAADDAVDSPTRVADAVAVWRRDGGRGNVIVLGTAEALASDARDLPAGSGTAAVTVSCPAGD